MGNDKTGDENLTQFAYPQVGKAGPKSSPTNYDDQKSTDNSKNSDNNSNNKPDNNSNDMKNSNNEPSTDPKPEQNSPNDSKKPPELNRTDKTPEKPSNNGDKGSNDIDNKAKTNKSDGKTAKPTDLEAQLNSLSGLGTPKPPPEVKERDEDKPDDLSQPIQKSTDQSGSNGNNVSAPPTLGKGEVKTKDDKDSPLKKIASKLSKVKDEITDPSISMGEDGVNLSGNNPIETPMVPPAIGPNQEPLSPKEVQEMKEKAEDQKEVAVMKDQLKNLRESEQVSENISVNSSKSMDQNDTNTGASLQQSAEQTSPSTSTQTTPPATPPMSPAPSTPVMPSLTPNVSTTSPSQSQTPSSQGLAPDPMGLNQPMQPIKQVDPDKNDNSPDQMESPMKSDQTDAEKQKIQDIAQKQMNSSPSTQPTESKISPTPTTPSASPPLPTSPTTQSPSAFSQPAATQPATTPIPTPAKKPTLPTDPVIPNPTVTKVTEDLAPEVDEKHKATPMATIEKAESKDAPKVKHARYPYTIDQLLDIVVERDASDLHITVGYPAMIRVDGALVNVLEEPVKEAQAPDLILPVLPEQKKELLDVNREVDLAYPHREDARFRINAYYQQQTLAAAFRLIPNRIRTIDELKLPQVYHKLTKLKQGLVLVTGPTGSGKSTTLAAIIQEINENRPDHIITIEDPVEYVFPKAQGMVDQRELHEDTHSWEIALRSAMRQDPDVILVGEMRDYDTISAAITLAETGHLVFATLHTNSAAQTLDRIIDVFPEHQQAQVRSQVSLNIEAVIAQRLIPLQRGGRTAVSEIMIATPAIRNLIREAKTHQIDNVIRTSADIGMISLEHTLVRLVRENVITMERAQEYAVHPEEIVRLLKS